MAKKKVAGIVIIVVVIGLGITLVLAAYPSSWFEPKEKLYENPTEAQIEVINQYCSPSVVFDSDIDFILTSQSPHRSDSLVALLAGNCPSDIWHDAIEYSGESKPQKTLPNQMSFTYDAEKRIDTFMWAYRLADENKTLWVITNVAGDVITQIAE